MKRIVAGIFIAYAVALAVGFGFGFPYWQHLSHLSEVHARSCVECDASGDDVVAVAIVDAGKLAVMAGSTVASVYVAKKRGWIGIIFAILIVVALSLGPRIAQQVDPGNTGTWGLPYFANGFHPRSFVGDTEWLWSIVVLPLTPLIATIASYVGRRRLVADATT